MGCQCAWRSFVCMLMLFDLFLLGQLFVCPQRTQEINSVGVSLHKNAPIVDLNCLDPFTLFIFDTLFQDVICHHDQGSHLLELHWVFLDHIWMLQSDIWMPSHEKSRAKF